MRPYAAAREATNPRDLLAAAGFELPLENWPSPAAPPCDFWGASDVGQQEGTTS